MAALSKDDKLKPAVDNIVITVFALKRDRSLNAGSDVARAIEEHYGLRLDETLVQSSVDRCVSLRQAKEKRKTEISYCSRYPNYRRGGLVTRDLTRTSHNGNSRKFTIETILRVRARPEDGAIMVMMLELASAGNLRTAKLRALGHDQTQATIQSIG
jgi:hypothetical protein